MGTIVKAHTFTANNVANASSVNRDFDDIYNEFNGNIDSANMASTFTLGASKVGIVSTFYSAALLSDAVKEFTELQRGLHTIHAIPIGLTGNGRIFPGKFEVNGQLCTVTTGFTWCASLTRYDSGVIGIGGALGWLVVGESAVEITQSDIFTVAQTSITTSGTYDIDKRGYYYAGKRVIAAIAGAGTGLGFNGWQSCLNPDGPQRPFTKLLDSNEYCGAGFAPPYQASGTGGWAFAAWTRYDRNLGAYSYDIAFMGRSLTGDMNIIVNTNRNYDFNSDYRYENGGALYNINNSADLGFMDENTGPGTYTLRVLTAATTGTRLYASYNARMNYQDYLLNTQWGFTE